MVTLTFVSMLNKRFGEAEFAGPKRKLKFYLAVFSLSFFVRGTWDLFVANTNVVDTLSPAQFAPVLFFIYFLTEWLPVFIIYLAHVAAFHELLKRQNERA